MVSHDSSVIFAFAVFNRAGACSAQVAILSPALGPAPFPAYPASTLDMRHAANQFGPLVRHFVLLSIVNKIGGS